MTDGNGMLTKNKPNKDFKQNRTISDVYNNFYSFSFTLSAIYVSFTTRSKKLSPWENSFFFFFEMVENFKHKE